MRDLPEGLSSHRGGKMAELGNLLPGESPSSINPLNLCFKWSIPICGDGAFSEGLLELVVMEEARVDLVEMRLSNSAWNS